MNVRQYSAPRGRTLRRGACAVLITVFLFTASSPGPQDDFVRSRASASRPANSARAEATLSGGNVKEFVPARYLKKYLRWKTEYLSTEAGRTQWERYARDGSFTLTIIVSPDMGHGGIVGGYRWDASGKLVAASVVLGGPRLAEITRRMGGTPSEIKREREYGAEANALLFLEERMRGEQGDRALFRRIRKSIHEYAEGRFQLFR